MLTVDDLQELTVGIDDAPDFGRLPVNILELSRNVQSENTQNLG